MKTGNRPRLAVIILAAGFSSRLGRPKALARVRSLSLLRRTLILVAQLTSAKIVVVAPPRAARYRIEARGIKVQFAVNRRRATGLSSSVRRGLAEVRYSPCRSLAARGSGRIASARPVALGFALARRTAARHRKASRGRRWIAAGGHSPHPAPLALSPGMRCHRRSGTARHRQ